MLDAGALVLEHFLPDFGDALPLGLEALVDEAFPVAFDNGQVSEGVQVRQEELTKDPLECKFESADGQHPHGDF